MTPYSQTAATYSIFIAAFLVAMPVSNYLYGNVNSRGGNALIDALPPTQPKMLFAVSSSLKTDSGFIKVVNKDDKPSKDAQFWQRVHSIESASGKIRYQGNDTNCNTTKRFCGHYQIGYQALKDINCTSKKCLKDRDNYERSLAMAKRILAKKLNRYPVEADWLKYAMYQQGANGIKTLILASKGKKKLSKTAMKRIARNTIYSMRDLKTMGSRKAAISYLNQWRVKWQDAAPQIAKL